MDTTTTQQKRPRIDPYLAATIDERRGNVPFEQFVNRTLRESLYKLYTVEKDPDARRKFRVISDPEAGDDTPAATGLTHTDASIYADLLNAISEAEGRLSNAMEDTDLIEEIENDDFPELLDAIQIVLNRLYDMADHKLGTPHHFRIA